jgi:transcriptional regulator with XRE-family HTH domain
MTLKKYMEANGYTDTKFADQIGVSRVAVTLYRNGQRIPRPAVMERIVDVTSGQVNPNDFYIK